MSGAALAWAKSVTAPSRTSKAVLVCLADYADADGCAWPAIRRLAGETQCSERAVQRAIRCLEDAGIVSREPDHRKDGGQTSNRYRLEMQVKAVEPPRQNDTPPVSVCHPPRCHQRHPPGVTSVTPI